MLLIFVEMIPTNIFVISVNMSVNHVSRPAINQIVLERAIIDYTWPVFQQFSPVRRVFRDCKIGLNLRMLCLNIFKKTESIVASIISSFHHKKKYLFPKKERCNLCDDKPGNQKSWLIFFIFMIFRLYL